MIFNLLIIMKLSLNDTLRKLLYIRKPIGNSLCVVHVVYNITLGNRSELKLSIHINAKFQVVLV